jgi:hypothetical protein
MISRGLLFIVLAAIAAPQGSADDGLTPDQIAVYRAFLAQYRTASSQPINLSNHSVPLAISEADRAGCLKGIEPESSTASLAATHTLTSALWEGSRYRLVDQKEQLALIDRNFRSLNIYAFGLLRLSEISFDRPHRYAILSFGFTCGGLCGEGSMMVFERSGTEWKPTNRRCSMWVA